MKVVTDKILDNADMSAGFVSEPILLDQIYGFSLQAIFTGTPNGSFKLQVSNQDVFLREQVTEWTDLADSSTAITAAGDIMYNVTSAFYRWVRIVYTRTSGSGNCDVTLTSKGV
jgi:hypothetical protein